jgi:hypothetical protein
MGDYFYVPDGILMGKIFSTIGAAIFFVPRAPNL